MELTSLKGIGEKTAGAFNRLGIFSAEDLIRYYPRDYETFEEPVPLYKLEPGKVMTVEGVLGKDAAVNRFNGLTIVNAYLSDMTGKLQLSWYNAPFIKNSLRSGSHLVFRGRIYEKNGRLVMSQPKIYVPEVYKEKYQGRMMPLYSLTNGISNNTVMKAVAEALSSAGRNQEYLPEWILEKNSLGSLDAAAIRMHFPRNPSELDGARKRAAFDEFFISMLAGARLSDNARRSESTHRCRPAFELIRFIADLPFELTKAQLNAYKEIVSDMSSGRVMNRLVEGDVGSGKTVVAIIAMLYAALNGYQAAIMAPTAVLAKQHFDTINKLLDINDAFNGKISTVLLTGSATAAERKEAYRRIKAHEADIIIGTHTLFQDKIEYDDLGLIVTDEQHRFGVGQREALYNKGNLPHTLVMSATPIPRTLAIILYSEMDISVINERPAGRIPVKNCVVGPSYRRTAYKFIFDELKKGRQAYIICPSIEAGEDEDSEGASGSDTENVIDYAGKLSKICPEGLRIAILHGRMKADEKEKVMQDFKDHKTDLLISTTVVEVGVDVPNSTVMMIENAERFGLAELHQLRGRVGRGQWQSYCIMINTSDSDKAAKRLEILNSSNDGFRIAEEDLKLRGPGDIFGIRQSGDINYRVGDIYRDTEIIRQAREASSELMEKDPKLENPDTQKLRRILDAYIEKGYIV